MKFLKHVAFAAAMGCVSISAFAVGHYSPDQGYAYDVVRHGVMISEKMLPNEDGRNINGPTVIKAPSWLKNAPASTSCTSHITLAPISAWLMPISSQAPGRFTKGA